MTIKKSKIYFRGGLIIAGIRFYVRLFSHREERNRGPQGLEIILFSYLIF